MAATYTPDQVGISAPAGGFQQGGWYGGRQYYNGTLSDAGVIHPESTQQGAGQAVSAEVNAQSAAKQGVAPQQFTDYLAQQNLNFSPGTGTDTGGAGTGDSGGGGGFGMTAGMGGSPGIDLPSLYAGLTQSEGINDLEKGIADKTASFNDAQSKINDNPFLSEANRVGRVQKLQTDYNNDIKASQDQLAMKKADIQTQLDLQTKQFDINSQAAQQAMSQFNSLLSSGALDNASGSDIANLTRATGMSSNMIQSAVNASKAKNVQTHVIPFDDGTNQGFAIIDQQTGRIISKQIIAGSKILGTAEDKAATKTGSGTKLTTQDYLSGLTTDASSKNKYSLASLVQHYQAYLPIDKIYQVYNQLSPNGKARETLAQVKAGKYNYK